MDHAEPVEKVFPESSGGYFAGQVIVGGGDEAKIDRNVPVAANSLNLFGFQYSEQLGLERPGDFADFVEQQGAAMGGFELAFSQTVRAGESAFSWPNSSSSRSPSGRA